MSHTLDLIGDALVIGALLVLTIGVFGVVRMPNLALKIHSASMMVVLGAVVIALASAATGIPGIAARGVLVAVLLLMTTPVAAHAMARAAWQRGELMEEEDGAGCMQLPR